MQQTFLGEVASKLYEQYGDDISSLTIVLPSNEQDYSSQTRFLA